MDETTDRYDEGYTSHGLTLFWEEGRMHRNITKSNNKWPYISQLSEFIFILLNDDYGLFFLMPV